MEKIKVQKAKHVQLKEILIGDICKNRYAVGGKLPSEQELIRQYAVSNTTVHKALAALVHEGYIYREKGRGTFVADYKKSSRLKDKCILGFVTVFSEASHGLMFSNMLNGISDGIQEHGYEMIFRSTGDVTEQEVQQINQLADIVDGLVIFPSAMASTSDIVISALRKLQERQIPFVLVDRYLNGLNCNYVVTDNFAGTYGAVEHLAKLGHKSIALFSFDDWECVTSRADRVKGYEQAVEDFNVEKTLCNKAQSKILIPRKMHPNYVYERIVENIMEVGGSHSAVVTTEYYPAVGIVEAAQRMGLNIPQDLAVIGFDEHLIPGHYPSVEITTVIQPIYNIGRTAINILIDNVENGIKKAEGVFLKPRLVVKDSCGARLVGALQ